MELTPIALQPERGKLTYVLDEMIQASKLEFCIKQIIQEQNKRNRPQKARHDTR